MPDTTKKMRPEPRSYFRDPGSFGSSPVPTPHTPEGSPAIDQARARTAAIQWALVNRVRPRMKQLKMSRTALAHAVGVAPAQISRVFSGSAAIPIERMMLMCSVVEVSWLEVAAYAEPRNRMTETARLTRLVDGVQNYLREEAKMLRTLQSLTMKLANRQA